MLKADALQDVNQAKKERSFAFFKHLEAQQGVVFTLAHIKHSIDDSEHIFAVLEEHIERLAQTFGSQANPQHRFEQFLSALNEAVTNHVSHGDWQVPIEQFSAIVGIASGSEMYLSGTGELTALFLHKKVTGQFQVFNLSRSIQTEQSLPTWEKAFAVVLDGDLHDGDVLCLANMDLQRKIPADDLNTILATLPPAGTLEKIRQYFPLESPLSILILQASDLALHKPTSSQQAKPLSELSIEHLETTRDTTSSLLEDQSPKTFKFLFQTFRKWIVPQKSPSSSGKNYTRFHPLIRALWRLGASSLLVAGKLLLGLTRDLSRLLKRLTKKTERQDAAAQVKDKASDTVSHFKQRYNKLPNTTKYLSLAVVLIVAVFFVGLSIHSKSKAESEALAAYANQVTAVQELIDRADSAFIYKDEEQAKTYLTQAIEALATLPTDTPERQETANNFESLISTSQDELNHVVTVPDPPMLGDLTTVSENLTGQGMVAIDGTIYVLASDGLVYELDKAKKSYKPLTSAPMALDALSLATADETTMAFSDARTGITTVDPTDGTTIETTLLQSASETWKNLYLYADRLYVLSEEKGDAQIYRYSNSGDDYGAASAWIKSKTQNLATAVDLAIDGTIFVLREDGSLVRFLSGSEIEWSQGIVEPAFQEVVDLWTDADSEYLYLLEPSQQRLVILEKESGDFVVQYKSPLFSEALSFFVNEETRSVYLLIGSKVYTIAASHL